MREYSECWRKRKTTTKPEYYKRVLITYRNRYLKKNITTIGYMSMDGTWHTQNGTRLIARVILWEEMEG